MPSLLIFVVALFAGFFVSLPSTEAAAGYSAAAHCRLTGITGRSSGQGSPSQALARAIDHCVRLGGIPNCCREGANLISSPPGGRPTSTSGYAAAAHCRLTGATGRARGQSSPAQAIERAISQCIRLGGIPDCCRQGANLIQR